MRPGRKKKNSAEELKKAVALAEQFARVDTGDAIEDMLTKKALSGDSAAGKYLLQRRDKQKNESKAEGGTIIVDDL